MIILWKKIQSFGLFKNILFLTWKFEDSLTIVETCVDIAFVIHSSKVFKQILKYFEYIKSNVFSTSHEYVVGLQYAFNVCH